MATPSKTSTAKTPAKKQASRAQKPSASTTPPVGEPVTLAQAKAIVTARTPQRSAAPAGSRAGLLPTETSAGDVARERRQLRLAQRREHKQRIKDYKAVMQVMKQRGVVGLAPQAPVAAPAAAPAVPRGPGSAAGAKAAAGSAGSPLQVLAEGDSWFDYPIPLFGGGIIVRLERRLGLPILNLAKAGDEVRFMMGVSERKQMAQQLRNGCPAGGAWDVLLFSGGGNDIVDDPMALWVRDFTAGLPPEQQIHRPRFDVALAMVRAGYEDLIEMRDALSPGTHLIFHTYDFAIPDGRGICHLGPWLKPTLDLRGFPSQAAGFEVVKVMLSEFALMLQSLQAAHTAVTVINGQGTLAPQPSSWHNELHPSRQGFNQFADLFHERLKALFPNRVPV